MKKILVLIVIVVALVAAGSLYFLRQAPDAPKDTGYADYLPADTLVTLSLRDINGLGDSFPHTPLGHFLSKDTMAAMLTDMQVDAEIIRNYQDEYDQFFAILKNPAFRMVFGDDVDLALLAVDVDAFAENPQQTMVQSLIIQATTSSSKTLESFARTFLKSDVEKFQHGDLELTRIRLDDDEFLYTYSQDNRLFLALDPLAIERCVAARLSGNTLQTQENYLAALEFRRNASVSTVYSMGFVQFDRLRSYLSASADEDLQEAGRYLQGVHFFTSVGGRIAEGWKVEAASNYTYESLDPAVKELVDSASQKNTSLHLMEETSLAYSWSSSLGAKSILETLSATDPEHYKVIDQQLQQELGFSLDQVVNAFGPQYGMVLKEIVQEGMFPLPKMVLFLQVGDYQVAEAVLARIRERVAERGMATEQQEQVGSHTIYSWAMLPGEATQPAVVLTEDILYLANGPSSLKQILNSEQKNDELSAAAREILGAELSAQVETANNGIFILQPSRFATQVKGAADWLASLSSATGGTSLTVFKDELLKLLQSTEVAVFVSDLYKDHAGATVTLRGKQEKEGGQ
jgi:hypothetical protein